MKSSGIYLGIVSLFLVLCGIAEVLEVPIIYGIVPLVILFFAGILIILESKDA